MGDVADEPYIHYAAAMQKMFEDWCLRLMDTYLGDILRETGKLAFAGGGALNVKLNQRIVALDHVDELFVQPASGDSGTALGAATWVAAQRGENLARMNHVFLGPAYDDLDCRDALERRRGIDWRKLDDVSRETAELLAAGHPVAWFQGRMEFGPRALGGRSILGCPSWAHTKSQARWRRAMPFEAE
jgi:carbamoyltransferase